jgi:DNA-binding MarR family transcriptional regulator
VAVIEASTAEELTAALRDLVREARAATATLGPSSLPASIAALLGALASAGEQRVSPLATLLGVDLSVASRHAAAAIEHGFVERRPDPQDGRAALLRITPAGEQALAAHRGARVAWVRALTADWSEEDARSLATGLGRLRDDARRARAVPPSATP